jgi:hypothetical protein
METPTQIPTPAQGLSEPDLRTFKEALAELLDRGSILGFESKSRELYQRASGSLYDSLAATLRLLEMELVNDDDRLLLQARPLDTCTLLRRFDQTESLFVLALWKVYDEHRQAGKAGAVILSLDDFYAKLKSYWPNLLKEPQPGLYDRVLRTLQRRNLVRYAVDDLMRSRSEVQVLPTILYVMPFASLEAWATQAERFQTAPPETSGQNEDS